MRRTRILYRNPKAGIGGLSLRLAHGQAIDVVIMLARAIPRHPGKVCLTKAVNMPLEKRNKPVLRRFLRQDR